MSIAFYQTADLGLILDHYRETSYTAFHCREPLVCTTTIKLASNCMLRKYYLKHSPPQLCLFISAVGITRVFPIETKGCRSHNELRATEKCSQPEQVHLPREHAAFSPHATISLFCVN